MLDVARRNLEEHFSVVGLSEHFDATLLMLKQAFDWHGIFYVRQNVNTDRPAVSSVSQATLDLIQEHNWLDVELYKM